MRTRRIGAVVALTAITGLALVSCYQPASGGMLYQLRMCETGGNYAMHTWVDGREYAGAYGFDTGYWRAQGHRPDPQHASPAVQDTVELADIRMLGVRHSNPGCAAKLGLY